MKPKHFIIFAAILTLLFTCRLSAESPQGEEVISPGDSVQTSPPADVFPSEQPASPDKDAAKPAKSPKEASGGGLSIMSSEQGDELDKKLDKMLEEQKKLIEKLDQMQKDLEFIKAASRRA